VTTVTIVGGLFTYTGAAQTPATVTVTGAGGLSLTPTAGYTNNVNAGRATASYSYAGDANHRGSSDSQDFTIDKANASFTVTPYTVTYDRQAHTATVSTVTGVNGETGSAVGTVTLNTTHTDAGTYSDSWSFAGSANYNDIASTTITNVINQAPLTITANDDTKVYGTSKAFSSTAFTQSGLIAGDTITGVTETSTGAPATATAGAYDIVASAASGSDVSNYTISYVKGTLTVSPTITVPAAQIAYEDVDKVIGGISIGDGASATLTVTLQVGHGTLALGTTTGLATVAGNGTGSVTLIGSTANLNAALATLVYHGSLNYGGDDALSLTATDGGLSATPTSVAINVVSVGQQAANLQAQVSALGTAEVLNSGQANSLIGKLNLQGNGGDVGKVQAFLNQVASFVQDGSLTQGQADSLQYWGNILLLGVSQQ
jgi:hypothetical protein